MNTTELHIPTNRVRDIEGYFLRELSHLYPAGEIRQMVWMLAEAFLGWDRTAFLLHRDDTVNQSDLLRFHWAAEDLKRERPIQQIIGYTEFCGHRILVDSNVLVPRPETEEMTTYVGQQWLPTLSGAEILDLCTGSGCIAVALAAMAPEATVYGVDVSERALAVARENACLNHVEVEFVQCDLLRGNPALGCDAFDLIVSNPPYVRQCEKAQMRRNVLDYEPPIALFVDDGDPLIFYRRIGSYAQEHLKQNGTLVVEINEELGRETCELFESQGFATSLMQDFRGKDRMVFASFN